MGLQDLTDDQKKTACIIGGCGCGCAVVATAAVLAWPVLVYGTVGTIGWKTIRDPVNYDNKYHQALQLADKSGNRDLNEVEYNDWFKEMGVVRNSDLHPKDVRPSYDALDDYIEKYNVD